MIATPFPPVLEGWVQAIRTLSSTKEFVVVTLSGSVGTVAASIANVGE